jgi:hypothetical protein
VAAGEPAAVAAVAPVAPLVAASHKSRPSSLR